MFYFVKRINYDSDYTLFISSAAVTSILQTKACKSALRFGDPLTRSEQRQLIRQLAKCAQPFHCAHGRPSLVHIADCPISHKSNCTVYFSFLFPIKCLVRIEFTYI